LRVLPIGDYLSFLNCKTVNESLLTLCSASEGVELCLFIAKMEASFWVLESHL